jgi:hypothetical protein
MRIYPQWSVTSLSPSENPSIGDTKATTEVFSIDITIGISKSLTKDLEGTVWLVIDSDAIRY